MKSLGQARKVLVLCIGSLLVPGLAMADAGVPMLAVTWPGSWLLLVPVVILEAAVARRVLGQEWRASLRLSVFANVASAVFGVPLSWFLPGIPLVLLGGLAVSVLPRWLGVVFAVPMHFFWLPPIAESQYWLIPCAAALLCIPAYVVSVWLERWVAAKALPDLPTETIQAWALKANRLSYGSIATGLAIVAVVFWFAA
jgi:hypothetical protein